MLSVLIEPKMPETRKGSSKSTDEELVASLKVLITDELSKVRTELQSFKDEVRNDVLEVMKSAIEALKLEIRNLNKVVREQENDILNLKDEVDALKMFKSEDVVSDMKVQIESNIVDELENRQARRNNAIFFGIGESERAPEDGTSADHDKTVISQVLSAAGVSNDIRIKRCFRIGVKRSRDRPIKVVFNNFDDKMTVLRNARNLRHLSDENKLKRVYIKADLTPRQLEHEKRLREELLYRRKIGENVIIKEEE